MSTTLSKQNTKKFLTKDDLIKCLSFLKDGRDSLAKAYLDSDDDRYFYSFRFLHSSSALKIVKELMMHKWIDEQMSSILKHYANNLISRESFNRIVSYYLSLITVNPSLSSIFDDIIKIKIDALSSMLDYKRVFHNNC